MTSWRNAGSRGRSSAKSQCASGRQDHRSRIESRPHGRGREDLRFAIEAYGEQIRTAANPVAYPQNIMRIYQNWKQPRE